MGALLSFYVCRTKQPRGPKTSFSFDPARRRESCTAQNPDRAAPELALVGTSVSILPVSRSAHFPSDVRDAGLGTGRAVVFQFVMFNATARRQHRPELRG